MRIIGMFLLIIFTELAAKNLLAANTNESNWGLSFFIVDENGHPLRNAQITIAYLDTSKPGAVTLSNWPSHMSRTNVLTDINGLCEVSGKGTPDAWQCNFLKPDYVKKFKMYSGPSNFSGFSGPGPAHQSHTEMLVSKDASLMAYPRWKMTIKAIDSMGNPIGAASAKIYYHLDQIAEGLTDSNGLFSFSTNTPSWDIRLDATKAGFYSATKSVHLYDRENYSPERWNQIIPLQLNKIGSIPMYAKREETKIQKENEPVGFDLAVGDWVAPLGTGKSADLLFAVKRKIFNDSEYNCELKLTFPNKGDGIVAIPPSLPTGSPLLLPHSAPEDGYQPERIWHFSNTNKLESVSGYFFRVHTELNENGTIKSALYGKIQGDIRFYAGTIAPRAGMGFNYYLNPIPNSLNVEFDQKHNLINNLKFLEDVKEP